VSVVKNVPIFEQTQSAPGAGASRGWPRCSPITPNCRNRILNEVGIKTDRRPTHRRAFQCPRLRPAGNLERGHQVATDTLNGQGQYLPDF